jgi:hypothetical protein
MIVARVTGINCFEGVADRQRAAPLAERTWTGMTERARFAG